MKRRIAGVVVVFLAVLLTALGVQFNRAESYYRKIEAKKLPITVEFYARNLQSKLERLPAIAAVPAWDDFQRMARQAKRSWPCPGSIYNSAPWKSGDYTVLLEMPDSHVFYAQQIIRQPKPHYRLIKMEIGRDRITSIWRYDPFTVENGSWARWKFNTMAIENWVVSGLLLLLAIGLFWPVRKRG